MLDSRLTYITVRQNHAFDASRNLLFGAMVVSAFLDQRWALSVEAVMMPAVGNNFSGRINL
jgi:hypothetical protein